MHPWLLLTYKVLNFFVRVPADTTHFNVSSLLVAEATKIPRRHDKIEALKNRFNKMRSDENWSLYKTQRCFCEFIKNV